MQTNTDQPQTSCGDSESEATDSVRRRCTGTDTGAITTEQYYALQSRRQAAIRLPPHGQRWRAGDIEGLDPRSVISLHRSGVVNCVERNYGCVNVWETAPGVYGWVTKHFARRPTCPGTEDTRCLETGVRCISAGETYSCTDPDCEATFGPETAKRLMNGDRPPRPGPARSSSSDDQAAQADDTTEEGAQR